MDFSEIKSSVVDQDKGFEIEILDPVDGKATGITFTVSGPDSEKQRKASLAMMDELAEMAGSDGRVTAEHRETARLNMLARCVLGFSIKEDGKSIPFNHQNCVRVLKVGTWLQAQVDAAASDRSLFLKGE